jgi:hypothetical protein
MRAVPALAVGAGSCLRCGVPSRAGPLIRPARASGVLVAMNRPYLVMKAASRNFDLAYDTGRLPTELAHAVDEGVFGHSECRILLSCQCHSRSILISSPIPVVHYGLFLMSIRKFSSPL